MNRTVKIIVLSAVGLIGLPLIIIALFFAALIMNGNGTWPFDPLERIEHEIALSNGGVVQIEAVEDRGFRSDGYMVIARYKPPGGQAIERIGAWEGYQYNPDVYVVEDLVVLPNPNQRLLHVRTKKGKWKFFSMKFPGEHLSLDMSYYASMTGLTVEEIKSIRKDLDPDEEGWSPSVSLKSFDPETREVYVLYRTNLETVRHIYMALSEDGTDLSLIRVKKEKAGS